MFLIVMFDGFMVEDTETFSIIRTVLVSSVSIQQLWLLIPWLLLYRSFVYVTTGVIIIS